MKTETQLYQLRISSDLYLRPASVADAPALFEIIDMQRPYLRQWLPFINITQAVSDTEAFLKFATSPDNAQEQVFVIVHHEKVAGLIGFKNIDLLNKSLEIGYWLSETEQRQGIMHRSCEALIKLAFGSMGINRIQIKVGVGNTRSSSIPRKLGFTLEGIQHEGEFLNDTFIDLEVYSLLKREWEE